MSQSGILDVENSNPQIPTQFVTDDGTAIPIANTLEVLGEAGVIETEGSGNTITIKLIGGGGQVSSVTGTLNQILADPTTGNVVLEFTDGVSIGSFQPTAPPVGGIIAPGKVGLGTDTPTAQLHLAAGSSPAGNAPLKFTSGINLGAPESGAVEYGSILLYTDTTSTRRPILAGKVTATATDYAALETDFIIGVTDTSAARDVTLPNANTLPSGFVFAVVDQSGAAETNNITIKAVGSTINGVAGATGIPITDNYGGFFIYGDGANYFIAAQAGGGGTDLIGITQTATPFVTMLGFAAGDLVTGVNNTGVGFQTLAATTTGTSNTAIGMQSMVSNTTGINNTALGAFTLYNNAASSSNTAIGYASLIANTANDNTAVGSLSLFTNISGTSNTAVGYSALTLNTASQNTAVGALSGDAITSGTRHAALGYQTLSAISTANDSTAVGYGALGVSTAGANTAVGSRAADALTSGTRDVAIGLDALGALTTANDCIAIGNNALLLCNAHNNIAIGTGAANAVVSGEGNIAIGVGAFGAGTAGGNIAIGVNALDAAGTMSETIAIGTNANGARTAQAGTIAIGSGAMDAATTGDSLSIAIGQNALGASNGGNTNIAIGPSALAAATSPGACIAIGSECMSIGIVTNTSAACTAVGNGGALLRNTGIQNTGFGYGTIREQTTGQGNTAVGYSAHGQFSASAAYSNSTAIGRNALFTSTASENTAVGSASCDAITTGVRNAALGYNTLSTATVATDNTAIGHSSLVVATGAGNTAVGSASCDAITTGANNTAIGVNSLGTITTGASNIAIGNGAGNSLTGGNSTNITIGHAGQAGDSGQIRIGTSATHTLAQMAGIVTFPDQVGFFARLSVSDATVTGAGTLYTFGQGGNLVINQTGGTNLSTAGVFTVPAGGTGWYTLTGCIILDDLTALMDNGGAWFLVNSTDLYYGVSVNPFAMSVIDISNDLVVNISCNIYLSATNTVVLQTQVFNGAMDTVSVRGAAITTAFSSFSGVKIC